ncbi:outer membrane protein [Terrihabitans rhizophilus]|uniref:Outer membrane protein n=1 Tax=Terrihabitans rhizophilus TaxID=3092662 RepID=A0ABU4RPI9_9HYPH|nr:outer membrane protein [Terrihabitans sp. PJ23]MDX6805560.1 outer membrane protein [Terrihabitans sp. PJ23]
MKTILLAGAAFVALSTASFAADMPAYPAEAAIAPVAAESDWSGFYLGVQGGYNWVEGELDGISVNGGDLGDPTFDIEDDGFNIGIYSGINRQWGNWVVGIDNSISYVDIDTEVVPGLVDAEINAWSTTRGRVGYAFGNFLVFAAGGLSLANVEVSSDVLGDDDSHLMVGYTVGGGVEAKFGGNWSARVEYLYTDFDDERFSLSADGVTAAADVSFDMQTVRGGIAYHF